MAFDHAKRQAARHAFVMDGLSLKQAASRIGVSSKTIERWKDIAAEQGDDWMAARADAAQVGARPLTAALQSFATAVEVVARAVQSDEALDATQRLERLERLSSIAMKMQGTFRTMGELMNLATRPAS